MDAKKEQPEDIKGKNEKLFSQKILRSAKNRHFSFAKFLLYR